MGIGDVMLCLYTDLKTDRLLDGIDSVAELGSQTVWTHHPERLEALFAAFNRPLPPPDKFARFVTQAGDMTGIASSRSLHELLGFKRYTSIDIDAAHGALPLDLNFDEVPAEHRGQYRLVTNHGTAEHVLNQANVFKAIHDLTASGGLMLNAGPFIGCLEHGFFNYQPNFFKAIARYNAYEVLGTWINRLPQVDLVSLVDNVPLVLGQDYVIVSLARKTSDAAFCMPIQYHYEFGLPEASRARYRPFPLPPGGV